MSFASAIWATTSSARSGMRRGSASIIRLAGCESNGGVASRLTGAKKRPALCFLSAGRETGNVLLSHSLAPHYHRGCSVSLPCSEWERVGPLRWDHQKGGGHCEFWIADCGM